MGIDRVFLFDEVRGEGVLEFCLVCDECLLLVQLLFQHLSLLLNHSLLHFGRHLG